jgi:hypothetical protein
LDGQVLRFSTTSALLLAGTLHDIECVANNKVSKGPRRSVNARRKASQ